MKTTRRNTHQLPRRNHLTPRPNRRRLLVETLENRSLLAVLTFNDPGYATQWELNNTGQTGGTNDVDIDAPEAWTVTTGSMKTVLAEVDDGIDFTNPDVYLNIWLNQGEIPAALRASLVDTDTDGLITFRDLNDPANAALVSDLNQTGYIDGGDLLLDSRWANGIDDEGNGKVDDLVGWDFVDNDNDPRPGVNGGHATGMAKWIGAIPNNGVGIVGIDWSISMMPVRIRPDTVTLDYATAAAGLDYGVAEGAPIAALYGGNYTYSQIMYDSIDRARVAGQLVVAPAGNDSANNDATPRYPASFNNDNIISATGFTSTDTMDPSWDYGATSVDVAGPSPGGTSASAAYTAGVAALLKTAHPDWTYQQIKGQILSTVDPSTAQAGKTVSGGRLNAANALGVSQISISDATATESRVAAQFVDVPISSASSPIDRPKSIVKGPNGDYFVTSSLTNAVLRYSGSTFQYMGQFVTPGSGGLSNPIDLTFANGKLFVSSGDSVLEYDGQSGTFLGAFVPSGANGIHRTTDVVVHNGQLYVSAFSGGVYIYDLATGAFVSEIATNLVNAGGMTFGPDGNLYVTEIGSTAVMNIYRYDGVTGALLGIFVPAGSGGLITPGGIKFGPDGALYVADLSTNASVLRYDGSSGAFLNTFVTSGQAGISSLSRMLFVGRQLLLCSQANDEVVRFDSPPWEQFNVTLSTPSAFPVTVNYASATGTAMSGSDFVGVSGSLTIPAGQTAASIIVQTLDDTAYEGNETFVVNLSNPVGGVIADGQGVGTIVDNDPLPTKFYVVNDGSPDRTYEYAAAGTAVENYATNTGNTAPRGAASTAAGDKVWVVDANKNVYVYSTSGGLLGSWSAGSLPSNADVQGVTTNGTDVWIVDNKGDKVYRYTGAASRLSGSQSAASSFSLNSSNTSPTDLVTDGASIWVVNDSSTDKVFKYTVSGTLQGSWTINSGGGSPTGITIDPVNVSNIWIVDSSTDRVYQFDAAASRTSGSQSPSTSFALSPGNTNPQGIADPPVPSVGGRATPVTGSSTHDSALLAVVGELDGLLGGKKRR